MWAYGGLNRLANTPHPDQSSTYRCKLTGTLFEWIPLPHPSPPSPPMWQFLQFEPIITFLDAVSASHLAADDPSSLHTYPQNAEAASEGLQLLHQLLIAHTMSLSRSLTEQSSPTALAISPVPHEMGVPGAVLRALAAQARVCTRLCARQDAASALIEQCMCTHACFCVWTLAAVWPWVWACTLMCVRTCVHVLARP